MPISFYMTLFCLPLWFYSPFSLPYSFLLTHSFLLTIKLTNSFLPRGFWICYSLCLECFSTKFHDSSSHSNDFFLKIVISLKSSPLTTHIKDIFLHHFPIGHAVFDFAGCIPNTLHIFCLFSISHYETSLIWTKTLLYIFSTVFIV